MDNRLHVVAVATNEYVGFIPMFLHYLLTAYPDYYAMVFVRDMTDDVLDALGNHEHKPRFNIIHGVFDDYSQSHGDSIALKYLLFTTDRVAKYFSNTRYAYIADIDVMYVRENPGILESHIEHCKTIGLPYSNILRRNDPATLTGVQFVTREYIDKIQLASDIWDAKFKEHGISLIDPEQKVRDERVLYELVRDSGIGLPPHPDDLPNGLGSPFGPSHPLYRPWHGINIGFARHPELLDDGYGKVVAWKDLQKNFHQEYFDLIPEWGKVAWDHMDARWSSL